MPKWEPQHKPPLLDLDYQDYILQGVSRTFALTIPQLPPQLYAPIANAYLLCRIADTIEDETALNIEQKRRFARQFIEVVAAERAPEQFARELFSLLSPQTSIAERDLIKNTARVIRITQGFSRTQRAVLLRCITVMSNGMAYFQAHRNPSGLKDRAHLDSYCYHVAGIVGEMLTELYCEYSATIKAKRTELLPLAVSFGQGLQLTNILKDVWDDRRRGACWLPRDVLAECGYDVKHLLEGGNNASLGCAIEKLVAIAHAHLRNALAYTLLIPKHEQGMRRFCFWAIGMAVLTLRKINRNRAFTTGQDVKISRRSVNLITWITNRMLVSDTLSRWLFGLIAWGLPRAAPLTHEGPWPRVPDLRSGHANDQGSGPPLNLNPTAR